MTIAVKSQFPNVSIMLGTLEGPKPANTGDLLKGKKVALFAIPGAFTPTCSARHLPGYLENKDALKAKGIDLIICMAVNDAFVMGAFGAATKALDDIIMLADGNGELTAALGLELDATKFGMGKRSQRFSMIINDNIIEEIFVEQGGEFKVSSAEYMLSAL